MNLWKTLSLLIVFLLLLFYVKKYEQGDKPDHESNRMVVELLGFKNPKDVTEVSVTSPKGSFTLKREGEATPAPGTTGEAEARWHITAPFDAKTDTTTTSSFVQALLTTKALHAYSAEAAGGLNDEDSGLKDPPASLTLKDAKGAAHTIFFGAKTSNDDGYYARPEGDKRLFIFAVYFVDSNLVNKDVNDLRDRDLLDFLTSDVKHVTLKYPAKENDVELELKGEQWTLLDAEHEPHEVKADNSAVESLLSTLSSARADKFVDSNPTDTSVYGLDHPRIEVVLGMGDKGENGLLVGNSYQESTPSTDGSPSTPTEKLYVQARAAKEVVEVAGSLYDSLLKDRQDFRDKTVLDIDDQLVTKITYSLDNHRAVLEKVVSNDKAEPPSWQLKEPVELPADKKVVEDLLRNIDLLRAVDFVDQPTNLGQYGLAKPRGQIVVHQGDQDLPAILLGREASDHSGMYVMLAEAKVVLKVRSSFAGDLKFDPNRLRDLLVVKVDRSRVQKIALRQKNGDLCVLELHGNEWKVTQPAEQEADTGRVGVVLTALEELRGDLYVADKADNLAQYGLDKPDVTATLTLDDGTKETVYAAQDPGGSLGVYLKRKGQDAIYRSDSGLILTDLKKGPDDFKPYEEPEYGPDQFGGGPPPY